MNCMIKMDSNEPEDIKEMLAFKGIPVEKTQLRCHECECGVLYDNWIDRCPKCNEPPSGKEIQVADYLILNEDFEVVKAIERKSSDMYSSIVSQKIYIQMEKLAAAYGTRGMVAYEGYLEVLEEDHPKMKGMISYLPTEAMDVYDLKFWEAGSKRRFVRYMWQCFKKVGTIPKVRYEKRNRVLALKQLRAMAEIPMCGQKISETLWKTFGSIQMIANMEEDELKIIKGIGERKAKAIYDFFRAPYPRWKKN